MDNIKNYIKKTYESISPTGSNEDFLNTVMRKAEDMDKQNKVKDTKLTENNMTGNVISDLTEVSVRRGRSSLTVAASIALTLLIGAGVILMKTDWLARPNGEQFVAAGNTDDVIDSEDKPNKDTPIESDLTDLPVSNNYKSAFDKAYGNAELLNDALNVPEYEVLQNSFENIDFEIAGVVGDENGMLSIVVDAIAKNGFEFDIDYEYSGVTICRDNKYRTFEFNFVPIKEETINDGDFKMIEIISQTPEKLTFVLYGNTAFEFTDIQGKEISFYLGEFWYWQQGNEFIPPDDDYEFLNSFNEWLQSNGGVIEGVALIKLKLNYSNTGTIRLDVNQTANLNFEYGNGEIVSTQELIKSVCISPMSFIIITDNMASDAVDMFNSIIKNNSLSIKMKNGDIISSDNNYFKDATSTRTLPKKFDFEINRTFIDELNNINIPGQRSPRLERYSFYNLIDLSKVEAIILGDLVVPVNGTENEVVNVNEDVVALGNENVFKDIFGNYELLDGLTVKPEFEVIENTYEDIDFEISGVLFDKNNILYIAIDAIAKNGFKFDDEANYTTGLYIDRKSPDGFPKNKHYLTINPELLNTPYKNEGYIDCISVTPDKVTILHGYIIDLKDGATLKGEEIELLIGEILYGDLYFPTNKETYNAHEIAGFTRINLTLNYEDIEAINIDVNKNVDMNYKYNFGKDVLKETFIKNICITPTSLKLTTNNIANEIDSYIVTLPETISIKMKNGEILTPVFSGTWDFDKTVDFQLKNTILTENGERSDYFTFYNLIDLNEVKAIIIGDNAILVQ